MSRKRKVFDTFEEDSPEKLRELSKKKYTQKDLSSLTPTKKQEKFLQAYYSQTPLILEKGSAGTGKSFVAIHAALSEVFNENNKFERLIIVRSAVETRKIGFLPGTEEEKMQVYERPYIEIIKKVIPGYKNSYNNLKALGHIEFMLSSHQRGMTYDNAIVIVDEAQNMDYPELRTILTRVGRDSKIIIIGDTKQNDLARYREVSGLGQLEAVMLNMPVDMTCVVEYTVNDIVRSGFVKEFLIADSKVSE